MLAARSPLPPIVVLWREGWHKGVVGIAAGRIAREVNRPALLLAPDGETATGSGRSIPGISLHGFLIRWEGQLERFGGHAQAVGLTVARGRLESLAAAWEEAASEWPVELLSRRYEYELELSPAGVDRRLMAGLARLEPTGQGNPQPLARIGPMALLMPPRRFGRGHLSGVARGDDGGRLALVGWRWGERENDLAGRFEALGYLEHDRYRGGPALRLVDVRPA
jgi:single-stranded-DNA-specific exonuclease